MIEFTRSPKNPILLPSSIHPWESQGAFNGSVTKDDKGIIHMVYRALSAPQKLHDVRLEVSSIGHATSRDGIYFENHEQIIKPEQDFEQFGCEDPRITFIEGTFYIFYTALSKYPFEASGIRVAVAKTKDFKTFEKHLVTPFNAKAMALFPGRINGKLVAILTANTDKPPSKIGIAFFDQEQDLWSKDYWESWYTFLEEHIVPLQRNSDDQVEVGAVPIETTAGWLLIYSYIKNYYSNAKIFGIEAVALQLKHPQKIHGRITDPFLIPQEDYELFGNVPNIVFPSGSLIQNEKLYIYYGAADTSCAVAYASLADVLQELQTPDVITLERYAQNPIITPIEKHDWEKKATFNPAAVYEDGKVHVLYRAMSKENTSVIGYASSRDGFHIDERLSYPIYVPKEEFELKKKPGNSGCEDPRLTKMDNRFYMCYTAYNGEAPPAVALTSITVSDFLNKKWNFEKPILISPPGMDDKDACLFPKKMNGQYVFLHRMNHFIWIDFVEDLTFKKQEYLGGKILLEPRAHAWDNHKIGITAPPIETEKGWLLLYHGVSHPGYYYKVGAVLLDLNDPTIILAQTTYPMFEPEMKYEKEGQVPNIVFPCGVVNIDGELFVYYGGADSVVGVATIAVQRLLIHLLQHEKK